MGTYERRGGAAEEENGNRKKSSGVIREGIVVKYAWIDGERDFFPLRSMCGVLEVSASGYADWKACGGPTQWLSDTQLLAVIRSVYTEFRGAYGSPRRSEERRVGEEGRSRWSPYH